MNIYYLLYMQTGVTNWLVTTIIYILLEVVIISLQ